MQVLADLKRRPLQKHLAIVRALILETLEILLILLQTINITGDRPPHYELRTFEASRRGRALLPGKRRFETGRSRLPAGELNVSGLKFRADTHL